MKILCVTLDWWTPVLAAGPNPWNAHTGCEPSRHLRTWVTMLGPRSLVNCNKREVQSGMWPRGEVVCVWGGGVMGSLGTFPTILL